MSSRRFSPSGRSFTVPWLLAASLPLQMLPVSHGAQLLRIQQDHHDLNRFVELRSQDPLQRQQIQLQAILAGLPVRQLTPDGITFELQRFTDGLPRYYHTNNVNAADTVSTDDVWPGGSLGLSINGQDIRFGIWDGGNVRTGHQEFNGAATNQQSAALSSHATHVGGTLVARGVISSAKGMSFAATLKSWDFNVDTYEMGLAQQEQEPIQISNHSYSYITGWYYGSFCGNRWVWFGDVNISTQEDAYFGFYDSSSADWDELAYLSPGYLMVKSAGNDRFQQGSGEHCHFDTSQGGGFIIDDDVHPADGGATGYDSIAGGSASAKNVLTIGAVSDITGGYQSAADISLASFSGAGPTDDGRIKPDLVANGISLNSPVAGSNTSYGSYSGTSMSSPNVAGSLGLLLQHGNDLFGSDLRASTIKALVLHTADEAGAFPGPDYLHGWGLLNTATAASVMNAEVASPGNIIEIELSDQQTATLDVFSDGVTPFKTTIAWTDPAGTPVIKSVDPSDLMLVNDIDLRITDSNNVIHAPWVLDPANPAAAATTGDNFRDVAEQVVITNPAAGLMRISLSHKNSLTNGAQTISLIITGLVDNTPDTPPQITSTPATDATVGVPYLYDNNRTVETSGTLPITLSLDTSPSGMTMTASGEITWVPQTGQDGDHNVSIGASNAVGDTSQSFVITVSEAPSFTAVNFNDSPPAGYAFSEDDTGTVTIEDDGNTLHLVGDRWQQISLPYTLTPDTLLEFDFSSESQGEIHGIGLDNDLALSSNRTFRLYGSQNWGLSHYANYGGSGIAHYSIPIGQFYTGPVQYLFFVMDHDISNPNGDSRFSYIRLVEPDGPPVIATKPTITSTANTNASVNTPYNYDADNRVEASGTAPITYQLLTHPVGMTITDDGLITWTPGSSQAGTHQVEIEASNTGGTDTQSFVITVTGAPQITSIPNTSATINNPYSYDANNQVEAVGTAPIDFTLLTGPTGMSVTTNGLVTWTPENNQEGDHPVTIEASNASGSDSQSFTITVSVATPISYINFNDTPPSGYGFGEDDNGTVSVENETTLLLIGDRWQQVTVNYLITPDTLLEFDFSSSAQGEIHGIGLDNDLNLSSNQTFRLYGTQPWGLSNYANYVNNGGNGVQHYVIPVGQFYTGFMRYLFFVMDHDIVNPTGVSRFSNVRLHEPATAPTITSTPGLTAAIDLPYQYDTDNQVDVTGTQPIEFELQQGPAGMTLSTTGLVSWLPGSTQTGDHLIEINASNAHGFDLQSFTINVAEAPAPLVINFNNTPPGGYGFGEDDTGTVTVEDNGATLHLVGDRWQQVAINYVITPQTILEFDFSSSSQGEIHGIGLDTSLAIDSFSTFRLYGTQNWGLSAFANYNGSGSQHYVIPIGQFYTGQMNYLFFVMDHDVVSPTGDSRFSNVTLHE